MITGPVAHRESRAAGLLYIAVILLGAFAEAFVRQRLLVPGDPTATLSAVASHEDMYRAAMLADLMMLMANIVIVAIFYRLFRPVARLGSLLIAFFTLVQVAMQGAILVLQAVPLLLLHGGPAMAAVPPPQQAALAYLSLRLLATGYNMVLMMFGVFCLLFGALAVRSGFVPRLIGFLMALAGLSYLANGVLTLIAPWLGSPILLVPCLVGEVSLALWLSLRGVNALRWQAAVDRPGEVAGAERPASTPLTI
jgi:hypothetical protein